MGKTRDQVLYNGRTYRLTEEQAEYLDDLQDGVGDYEIDHEEAVYLTLQRAGHPVTAQPEFEKDHYFKPHPMFGRVLLSGKPAFHRGANLFWERRNGDLQTNVSWKVIEHSPAGFEIGYAGSGMADLALNAMAELFPVTDGTPEDEINICTFGRVTKQAWRLHQRFKRRFLQNADRNQGFICWSDIQEWLNTDGSPTGGGDEVEVYPYDPAIVDPGSAQFERKMAGLLMVRRAVDIYWRAFYLVKHGKCLLCSSNGLIHINALADDASALIYCFCPRGRELRTLTENQRAQEPRPTRRSHLDVKLNFDWQGFPWVFDCPECLNANLLSRRPERDITTVNCVVCCVDILISFPPRADCRKEE
jgi:hypothetical protein